ncbi:zinc finger protein 813-like [Littorina saxatilis]|uniref:zinc finger protein 813-like n=1 Tax=Littorina saxatilis TaxID=31220 RepID=UPI0038B4D29D
MKQHYRDRLDATASPCSPKPPNCVIMQTHSPRHFPPSPGRSPLPQRSQTVQETLTHGAGVSPRTGEGGELLQRSMSEPFSNMRKDKQLLKPVLRKVGEVPAKQALPPEKPGKVYTCFYCQGEFSDALSLTRHSRTHGGSKPYSCTQCGRTFALYSALMNHERSHAPGRPHAFKCNSCTTTFLHEASLKAHQRRHNDARNGRGPGTKPYQCGTCSEWLSNEGSLKIHMQRHEGFDIPRVCSLCGTSFSCDAFLRSHSKIHDCEPSMRCVICIRHFRRSRVVLRHSDVHADDRRNVCDSCERRFPKVEDGSWRRMQLLLPEEKVFQCMYCGVGFSRLHQLATHETGHTDPLPNSSAAAPPPSPSAAARSRPLQRYMPTVIVN